jgi:hypothetical protein
MLTDQELDVVRRLGSIWNDLCDIVADGPARSGDLEEARHHIHALQWMVGSQAAARAHPDELRELGGGAISAGPATRGCLAASPSPRSAAPERSG